MTVWSLLLLLIALLNVWGVIRNLRLNRRLRAEWSERMEEVRRQLDEVEQLKQNWIRMLAEEGVSVKLSPPVSDSVH